MDGYEKQIDIDSKNPVTIAINEINAEALEFENIEV